MKKLLGAVKEHQILSGLIVFILLLGVPFLINFLFKKDLGINCLRAEWEAGDALNYYGVLLAAIIAIWGVYLTIQDSRKNVSEQTRFNELPHLTMDILHQEIRSDVFPIHELPAPSTQNEKEYYKEYRLREIYFIVEEGKINIKTGLTEEQQELVKHRGRRWISNFPNRFSYKDRKLISTAMEIENVGPGAAVNLRIGLNHKGNEAKFIPPRSLNSKKTLYLFIYAENPNNLNVGEYELAFYYNDILGNSYKQIFRIDIIEENENICLQLDLDSQQERI